MNRFILFLLLGGLIGLAFYLFSLASNLALAGGIAIIAYIIFIIYKQSTKNHD